MQPVLVALCMAGILGGDVRASAAAVSGLPRTILFADDDDVLYRPGTIRRVMEFKKYSNDPVVVPDKLWEGMIGWISVLRDPVTGKYQMWYQAYQERRSEDKSLKCVVCYAESDDGLKWTKPNLGQFSFYEEANTNIVLVGAGGKTGGLGDRYCNSVIIDPKETDPAKRYKMLYYDWAVGADVNWGAGVHLAYSPDGIRWTKHEGMLYKTPFGGKGVQPPFQDEGFYVEEKLKTGAVRKSWRLPIGMSDAVDLIYDPMRDTYQVYGKMWTPFPDGGLGWKHAMGRIESKDLIHWGKPTLVSIVNDRDPPHLEYHTSPVFIHNRMYFSINQVLDRSQGTMDAEFMSSRDGFRWNREFARQWVIARGSADKFDGGSIISNGTPIITDQEMRFYYGAYRGTAIGAVGLNRQVVGAKDYYSGVGLAIIPRDRFVAVGINPESPVKGQKRGAPQLVNTIGQVTLRPISLEGVRRLTLNAAANRGSVRVEILDEDGYRVRGFSRDDALALTADGLAQEAKWKNKSLRDLPPGNYHIRVHLQSADLFAVTLHAH